MGDERYPGYACGHIGEHVDEAYGAVVPPIYQTSLFTGDHWGYSRSNNPTVAVVERKIAALEGTEAALCFSSGMAALSSTFLSMLSSGDHVVSVRAVYGGTRQLFERVFPRFGVESTFVQGDDPRDFERAVRSSTRLFMLESPTTFTFQTLQIAEIVRIAHAHGIITVFDNSWATPIFQRPSELGVDVVVHSASKYLGGHSDVIAGVVAASSERIEALRATERALLGAVLDPFAAWLLLRGLRTLPVRMRAHGAGSWYVASRLAEDARIAEVIHPGLAASSASSAEGTTVDGSAVDGSAAGGSNPEWSGLFAVRIREDRVDIRRFLRHLTIFQSGPSWGGFESLVVHPASIHDRDWLERSGVPPNLVRLSIGLEEPDLLLRDLQSALSRAERTRE